MAWSCCGCMRAICGGNCGMTGEYCGVKVPTSDCVCCVGKRPCEAATELGAPSVEQWCCSVSSAYL